MNAQGKCAYLADVVKKFFLFCPDINVNAKFNSLEMDIFLDWKTPKVYLKWYNFKSCCYRLLLSMHNAVLSS